MREETIGGQRLICGDCLEVLPTLAAGSVDCCFTDPPYEIPKGSAFVRFNKEIQDWGEAVQNATAGDWLPLVPFAPDAYCLEFGRNHPEAVEAMMLRHRQVGLTPWHFVQIVKKAPPPTPRPKFVNGFEQALVSFQGKRNWYGGGYVVDRWIGLTPNRLGQGKVPTQKPLEPLVDWMKGLTCEGQTVLDPFMGSGTTLVAAELLGRKGIGIELSPEYFDIACRRIEKAVRDRELAQAQLTLTG